MHNEITGRTFTLSRTMFCLKEIIYIIADSIIVYIPKPKSDPKSQTERNPKRT